MGQVLRAPQVKFEMLGRSYFDALTAAMDWLAKQDKTMFIGQGVGCAGTTMTDTLANIPKDKLLEFPVAEDLQMGFCTGLSLEGYNPVCIFPRWNFLICAANQIVNHLDRLPVYSTYKPKVIIRVATPIVSPFYPGPQHDDDFSNAFEEMCRRIKIVRLHSHLSILRKYQEAFAAPHSSIMVEYTALYGTTPSGVKA